MGRYRPRDLLHAPALTLVSPHHSLRIIGWQLFPEAPVPPVAARRHMDGGRQTMAQDCPHCGLTNPPGAQRCDCGYDFSLRRVANSYLSNKQRERDAAVRPRKRRRWIILGTLAALWALWSLATLPAAISASRHSAYAAGEAAGSATAFVTALALSILFFRWARRESKPAAAAPELLPKARPYVRPPWEKP